MASEERVEDGAFAEQGQGIVPVVDYLKEYGFRVGYWVDAGDEVFKFPRIWIHDKDDDAGFRAVELVRGFAMERGYEFGVLRREWNYLDLVKPSGPSWVLIFCVPKNFANNAPATAVSQA